MARVILIFALSAAVLANVSANAGPFCQDDLWTMAVLPDATSAAVICLDGGHARVQP